MRRILYTTANALPETEEGYDLGRSTSNNLSFAEVLDDALLAELRDASIGYGTVPGDETLRSAVADGVGVDAGQVIITGGAIGALHLGLFCLCDHGDEVVTVTPGFPATFDLIQALGAVMRPLPLAFDEGYALDADRLTPLLTARTRVVLLASPHNPSGVAIPREQLAAVLERMAERAPDAWLLLDETFREAAYGDGPPAPSGATLSDRVLTVSSLSKAHGAPGLRLGWITCTDPGLLAHLLVGKGKTAISCSILDERLGARILTRAREVLADRNARLGRARDTVAEWVARNDALIEWVPPHAGGMCCVRLAAAVYDDARVEACYALAAERLINLATGDRFLDERRVFRLGFGALPMETLARGLEALEATLADAAG